MPGGTPGGTRGGVPRRRPGGMPRGANMPDMMSKLMRNRKTIKRENYKIRNETERQQKRNTKYTVTSKENTWRIIKSINPKKSSGFDGIPSKLIHISAAALVTPLNAIINKGFESGNFPKTLKLAKISPIDKKKGKKTPENHRPLSQLSGFSKILETAINEQLRNHIFYV